MTIPYKHYIFSTGDHPYKCNYGARTLKMKYH